MHNTQQQQCDNNHNVRFAMTSTTVSTVKAIIVSPVVLHSMVDISEFSLQLFLPQLVNHVLDEVDVPPLLILL